MEWKNTLRRTQSQKSVSSSREKKRGTEVGMRDRMTSVSQLVSRYQTSLAVSPPAEVTSSHVEQKQEITPTSSPPVSEKLERKLESPLRKNYVSARAQHQTNLFRSKSMGSLDRQPHRGDIGALKALFESKVTQQSSPVSAGRRPPSRMAAGLPVVKAEKKKAIAEGKMSQIHPPAVDTGDPTSKKLKEEETSKRRVERRRTIGGVDLEKLTTFQDEKRRGISEIRDDPLIQGLEKLPCSVKAMSARYLSKVTAVDQARSPLKPRQEQSEPSSVKKANPGRFQPSAQDTCAACLKPVYPMEKMAADKFIFHKNCFCCKHCKKKLSIGSYASLYAEFYCIFHYQQLFRRKGNYDEGFGYTQHKNRWLLKPTTDPGSNESDA